MTDKKKDGIFQKIFRKKSGCCCFQIEEVNENNQNESDKNQDNAKTGCCSINQKF